MIVVEIENKTYNIPQSWSEVRLKTFLRYFEKIERLYPACMKQLGDLSEDERKEAIAKWDSYDQEGILKYQINYIANFTDIPVELLARVKLKEIKAWYMQLEKWLSVWPQTYAYQNVIEWNGENWYLPEEHMKDSTFTEFIECAAFERQMEHLKNENGESIGNSLYALPNLLCVLLRKKNEPYSIELQKRKDLFLEMPMHLVFHVAFFLNRLNSKLSINTQIFTKALQVIKLNKKHTVGI